MITINLQSRIPVYQQLYDNVIRLVTLGILKADGKIPSVRVLATDLGINPNTVQKAYGMLEADGYIYSVKGKGSFISDKLSHNEPEKLAVKKQLKSSLQDAYQKGIPRKEVIILVEDIYSGGS